MDKDFFRKPLFHVFLIVLLGLIAYSNTFDVPFQFDDGAYIVENPIIRDPGLIIDPSKAEGLRLNEAVTQSRKTRAVAYMTFWINYRLGGFDVFGYHVFNLFVHISNALALYALILLTATTLPRQSSEARNVALFSALAFVAHPVNTEAVTYISQRFTSLAAFFYLAAMVFYAGFRSPANVSRRYASYFLCLTSAVLAMKTKENAFTLPLALLLYEMTFSGGPLKKRLVLLSPFFLAMLIVPLTLIAPDGPLVESIGEATRTQDAISRHDYLITQFPVVVTYLRLFMLPVGQNLDYDYPVFNSFIDVRVLPSFLFLSALFSLLVYLHFSSRKAGPGLKKVVSFGGLWFFIALSVESSAIALADVIFEHRVYLPSAGFFTALTAGICMLAGKIKKEKMKALIIPSAALILAALSFASYSRNDIWKDGIRLWEDVAGKSPRKARVHNNLASEYLYRGFTDRAIEHLETVIRLDPYNAEAYNNLGLAYGEKGQAEKAVECYRLALRIKPSLIDARFNLGFIYLTKGLREEAIEEFEAILEIDPAQHETRKLLREMRK